MRLLSVEQAHRPAFNCWDSQGKKRADSQSCPLAPTSVLCPYTPHIMILSKINFKKTECGLEASLVHTMRPYCKQKETKAGGGHGPQPVRLASITPVFSE